MSKAALRENLAAYMFIGPMLLGVSVLVFFPVMTTIILSFTDWNFVAGLDNVNFIGLDNFKELFQDDIFLVSIKNNMILMLVVPIGMSISLLLAVLINKQVYFKDFFKVVYFMPYISSVVAVAVVFQVLFHPSYGPINQFLISIGIEHPPKWLSDVNFALPSVMMILVWIQIGFQLIIYLAGLQNIPQDLYEAADIDGANAWGKFRHITLPMISSTSFFLLITGIISTFKVFDLIAVLTSGGPSNSTSVTVYYLYETAFLNLKSGYASAIALVLLLFVFLITLIQWYGQKKWVNY
ncbi:sugar ABC transporter permease [Paenibacillus sp. WQ 127069]|uniref:Sugar ABC transporter permease n=1 Tax=Paenibacillus baimaensis TaxID=2982185 RepID=A0ABT2UB13_9BACL|nr:sugar ABC transporter permease [Paenibacillus sp. WQ 127069]MCU6791361.1 sugar ABC transporter permease [Paenibacillus sp. WQ 127069]